MELTDNPVKKNTKSMGTGKKKKMSEKRRNDYMWAYLMILPTVLGLLIFYVIPFFQGFFYSLTDLGSFGKYKFIGLENFKRLFSDPVVWGALKNTLVFTIIAVPVSTALSIIVASLLNANIKGLAIYRTLYFIPAVTMPAAVSMVWRWLFNAEYGLINNVLAKFSIQGPNWITNPKTALLSVIIVSVWGSVGYDMVIFLAGIQGISKSYYEAAEIDGAGTFRKFFNITLPLLTPTIFFVLIMSLISSFQVFDYIYMMITERSPAIAKCQSIVYLFYKSAFMTSEKGYASAIAVVLFVIIMFITMLQVKLQKKWVNYD